MAEREAHPRAFVAYTQAVAAGDKAKADKAVADLTAYAKTVGTTLNQVNSNLPAAAVEEMVKMHITSLKAVVDAQKAGDQAKVYTSLRHAYRHMGELATALADATAKKFPEKFDGSASAPAAELRAGMTSLLREHVFLAASATGGALGGREAQFRSAAAELDGNSIDLSRAIGSAYGGDAEMAFLPLWRSHIGMVVDYTKGKAANDQAMQDKAVNDLLGYTNDFAAFVSAANENLPKNVVQGLVKDHALTLKEVIDAQADGDAIRQFMAIRGAGAHMQMIADPLAEATVAKFPDKFGGMAAIPSDCADCHSQAQMTTGTPAEIRQFAFRPATLEVPAGTTVTWTNHDVTAHTATATGGQFDSGNLNPGRSFSFTFDQAGTVDYVCNYHPNMQGTITVR